MGVDRNKLIVLVESNRKWMQRIRDDIRARSEELAGAARGYESNAVGTAASAVELDPSLETLETLRQVIRAKLENVPAR